MKPKHVVSISPGSSSRNSRIETQLLGQDILIERIGTDGDMTKVGEMFAELDGQVDAFGLGGTDLFLQVSGKRYYLRDSLKLVAKVRKTPIVCGAGLKNTLERMIVADLDGMVHWKDKKVLMVLAVDRFGMAETLVHYQADVLFGDLMFGLGVPIPLKSLKSLTRVAMVTSPIVTRLPLSWVYPIGKKQEETVNGWRDKYFQWAEVIAGDFHYIRRFAPQDLKDKIILTNTTTTSDVQMLKSRGVKTLITTTPRYDGRSLSTNMLEAAFVAISGKHPLSAEDYRELIVSSGIKPDILQFGNP